jgi:tetratricopeptide (TPR) repeat protein
VTADILEQAPEPDVQRLYTLAMLAALLKLPVATLRRWHRRGLIRPVQVVHRLAYFDFREVATARRLAELAAAGIPPRQIEKQLGALARLLPNVERPLAQLSVVVEGKSLLFRQGEGLIEAGGQWRFDFEAADEADEGSQADPAVLEMPQRDADVVAAASADRLLEWAAALEEAGDLDSAIGMYRAALAAGGPKAETCFQLAEALYRLGQVPAAIERYYMAVELDEDFVEARANLGCLLAETGQMDLALAAFEGALAHHPRYADAHYHRARLLEESGRGEEARPHWQAFLELSPDSPWAEEAKECLGQRGERGP